MNNYDLDIVGIEENGFIGKEQMYPFLNELIPLYIPFADSAGYSYNRFYAIPIDKITEDFDFTADSISMRNHPDVIVFYLNDWNLLGNVMGTPQHIWLCDISQFKYMDTGLGRKYMDYVPKSEYEGKITYIYANMPEWLLELRDKNYEIHARRKKNGNYIELDPPT